MKIGELNRRIEVLKYVTKKDDFGGEEGQWITAGLVWANIKPGSGTEHMVGDKVQADISTTITMRFYPSLSVMHRLCYGKKLYEITSVTDEMTAHRMTVVAAKELTDYGLQRKSEEG